jgi:tRNA-2-methylthio-N6-dimethylallyladenosine synthase
MNHSDSEIVNAIMQSAGYEYTSRSEDSDVILINTCAIREKAESKIWARLNEIGAMKRRLERPGVVTGVLGCMAERLKEQLVEGSRTVDVVVGPDAYRELPRLLESLRPESHYAMNV